MTNTPNFGLVYGSGNEIYAWYHHGFGKPLKIAERKDYVTSLCFHNGWLLDAGLDGVVRNTTTGEDLDTTGTPINSIASWKNYPFPLVGRDGQRVAPNLIITGDDNVLYGARIELSSRAHLFSLVSNSSHHEFSYRPGSLELLPVENTLYVASENVIKVEFKDNHYVAKKMTGYLTDFVHLAGNGQEVLALYSHNPQTTPKGEIVMDVETGKVLTFWSPTEKFNGTREIYGFCDRATMIGDTLIVGCSKSTNGNIYAIPITKEMRTSTEGLPAEPNLLLAGAYYQDFHPYTKGNPIIALGLKDLLAVIEKRQAPP